MALHRWDVDVQLETGQTHVEEVHANWSPDYEGINSIVGITGAVQAWWSTKGKYKAIPTNVTLVH